MTFTEEQVATIVVEVVRRLGLLGPVAQSPQGTEKAAELQLADKVITTRTIQGQLSGVKRLIVQPRAVVTPAVRDQLKQQNIELVRQTH